MKSESGRSLSRSLALPVDTAANVGQYTSIAIGADGHPVISYLDFSTDVLKVAKCGNPSCSSGNTLTVVDDTADQVGYYTSIAIGTDGNPVISYHDSTNIDFKVAKCGNPACSSGNVRTAVDATGSQGRSTSIAIGTDGIPVISYWDFEPANMDLKVARPPVS